MSLELVFLGTGAALQVPSFHCTCETCESARQNPEERRTRASVALLGKETVLIDAGPDMETRARGFVSYPGHRIAHLLTVIFMRVVAYIMRVVAHILRLKKRFFSKIDLKYLLCALWHTLIYTDKSIIC